MVATAITGRRPDASATLAIAGILAGAAIGVGLLDTAPGLTPFLAVAGVGVTAALSWSKHHNLSPSTAAPGDAQSREG